MYNNIRHMNIFNDDMDTIYKNIADEFCKNYYLLSENNLETAQPLFEPECSFDINGTKITGYNNLLNFYNYNNVYSISYDITNISSHNINSDIIINVVGRLKINNNNYDIKNFSETFYLRYSYFDKIKNQYIYFINKHILTTF